MQIRRMQTWDVPQVTSIERAVFSVPWSEQGFFDTLFMENVRFYVAEENFVVYGYCGIYLAADEGEITNVAVLSSKRRKGLGKQMMEYMLADCEKEGINQFVLEVRCSNAPAIALYENMGFHVIGTRKNFYEQPVEDALVMLRQ